MSGLYLHIPFCSKACHYCDFHFSTNLKLKAEMVAMICRELEVRKDYLSSAPFETIYFGGGTPSILTSEELDQIFNTIFKHYSVNSSPEITLEANPNDLSKSYLKDLKEIGINRLSIGVQSFNNEFLKYLNRSHNSKEAIDAVSNATAAGFDNISIDLIYGIPSDDDSLFEQDLESCINLGTNHISAYCLTIEADTVFGNWLKKGKIKPVDEEKSASQFENMIKVFDYHNIEQYEISNFARKEKYSRHNSGYWQNKPYLGVGPGAHSYNGESRQYNISSNPVYIKSLKEYSIPATVENLSVQDKMNEYLLTSIRTKWGTNLSVMKNLGRLPDSFTVQLEKLIAAGLINMEQDLINLTIEGKLLADEITSSLFISL